MKKLVVLAMAVLTACVANAQIGDDIQKSKDRAAKLQTLCDNYKASGNAAVDGYGNDMKDAAIFAIANSVQLEQMYKRQIGQTEDGVTDVTITKPTLDEWVAFAVTVGGEGVKIKSAVDKAKSAGEEAKNIAQSATSEKNPMKAAKAAKSAKAVAAVVEFGNAATPILLEESAAQVKAVNEIIETIKSGKNL